MTDGSFHSFALIVRHGACLYFARDGLPARYGKVVVALVVQGTRIQGLLLFREWHQDGIAINRRRLVEAFPGCTLPRRLPNTMQRYEETTQKKNRMSEYNNL